ncbi:uncharacterized protein B0I36DRAFT_330632 [Microdochium trichocladiopsis]|uniref:Vacuolar protein sorting-associated protein TDA6 n=1 Tax=Microdochium trichocladiopsis TaxID=1682393 RepID=A0A9P8Y093_9PEZI|nr:uncharacterized protein B0I36DRAFT_330632 [Microdochium trichocladiopsis]KAH7026419.1 hypothetical protein B0I36DRAFT_330632 [Microdochium trichocladiopsis]
MYHLRRRLLTLLAVLSTLVFLLWFLPRALNPVKPSRERQEADRRWVDTSPSWLDRQACRWLALCGIAHVRSDPPEGRRKVAFGSGSGSTESPRVWSGWDDDRVELRRREGVQDQAPGRASVEQDREEEEDGTWLRANEPGTSASSASSPPPTRNHSSVPMRAIPQYVLDHAPLVHLYSGEQFWPSDIAEHLRHMIPRRGGGSGSDEPIDLPEPPSLDRLAEQLNPYLRDGLGGGVFLSSEVDVEDRPGWLHSRDNVPVGSWSGDLEKAERQRFVGENDPLIEDDGIGYPAESTTWFDVDKAHPLNRISDPRQKPEGRLGGGKDGLHVAKRQARDLMPSRRKRSRVFRPDYTPLVTLAPGSDGLTDPPLGILQQPHNKPDNGTGYSRAPATLILVDKGHGVLDAYWFFHYSYNLGQTVLGVRYGNHVGDWEHAMVRFESGVPRAVYLSEHEGGQAYAWAAVEKKYEAHGRSNATHSHERSGVEGDESSPSSLVPMVQSGAKFRGPARPVIYSAVGSHAMYATPGDHPYVLPFKMLRDVTDRGPLWDPAQNFRSYWYDYTYTAAADAPLSADQAVPPSKDGTNVELGSTSTGSSVGGGDRGLVPTAENPDAPTSWFHYEGQWGDDTLRLGDERQYRLFGQYHYVAGPQGPKAKNLGRSKVCQSSGSNDASGRPRPCRMIYSLEEGRRRSWHS